MRAGEGLMLDTYCGAGGAAKGFSKWFGVVGVDIKPQPRYPFDFIRADVPALLEDLLAGRPTPISRNGRRYFLGDFVAAHASCPCQARTDLQKQNKRLYDELVPATRALLLATGLPYVIENVEGSSNVPGAELIDPVMLCGTMFPGLRVLRHRLFETNWPLPPAPAHPKHPLVFTHDQRKGHYTRDPVEQARAQATMFVQVTGGGNCTVANKRDAMGIDWMIGRELNEAVPPAYCEWVGGHLRAHLLTQQPHKIGAP